MSNLEVRYVRIQIRNSHLDNILGYMEFKVCSNVVKAPKTKKTENLNKDSPFFHHFPVTRNVKIHRPIHLGTFGNLCC